MHKLQPSWSHPAHSSSSTTSRDTSPDTLNSKHRKRGPEGKSNGRKKVAKACLACQRSHLTCDERRPCARCLKKGVGERCVEGKRKKAKYLLEGEERNSSNPPSNASPRAATHPHPGLATPVGLPSIEQTGGHDDLWLSAPLDASGGVEETGGGGGGGQMRFWSNPQPEQTTEMSHVYPFGTTAASSEYQMFDSMFSSMSPVYPSFGEPPVSQPQFDNFASPAWPTEQSIPQAPLQLLSQIDQNPAAAPASAYEVPKNPWTWADTSSTGTKQNEQALPYPSTTSVKPGKGLTANEVYQTVVKPYDYTEGYHFLMEYLTKHFEQRDVLRVVRALASFRPSLIALQMPMSEEDEVFLERSFQRTLIELEKLISYSATPTAVWRRTGEVCYANPEFCALVGRSEGDLLEKKTFVYQMFARESVIIYWESFSVHAFENTTQNFFLPTTLAVEAAAGGGDAACSCCFTIRRDVFDLPSVVIGQFLPVPADASPS